MKTEPGTAIKVFIRRGNQSRSYVQEHPPFPKKGDIITFRGEGAEWTVARVKPVTILLHIKKESNVKTKKITKKSTIIDPTHTREICEHQDAYLMGLKKFTTDPRSFWVDVVCRNCGSRLKGAVK